jgi:hypothetical protein
MISDRYKCSRIIEAFFWHSWWVWACAVFSFGLHEQASRIILEEKLTLEQKTQFLVRDIAKMQKSQEARSLQLASLNDPAWIELTLIRCLGLVPEGYTKIYLEEGAP